MVSRLDTVTVDEWRSIAAGHSNRPRSVAGPMLDMLRSTRNHAVFDVDHMTHQLQTATRAYRDGADDEVVLAALFHDVAEVVAGAGHGAVAAGLLRPYVRNDVYQVLRTHSDFQGRYYNEYFGLAADAYRAHADESWFALAVTFSDDWDQASFDPSYKTEELSFFEPMVQRMFARTERFESADET
jgi:predicted HD phosphohydrolase